ncbi:MAG: FHA domain-containing protein [Candidatus Coatesbacteria bacterium]|nr:FHA domain-containing protein [Candidatus Coatesbacteria bacterium]
MTEFELVFQNRKGDVLRFNVPQGSFILGRGSGADMRILEPSVSRQHAMIDNEGGVIQIRDLGSKNGTYVNGEPVMKKELAADDRIALGTQSLRLREKPAQAEEAQGSSEVTPVSQRRMFVSPPLELISRLEEAALFSIDDLLGERDGPKASAIRQQFDSMRSLFAISNVLASDSGIAVKLQTALEDVVRQVSGECGYILLIDEKTKRLVPLYSCSLVPGQATISRSVAETVIRNRVSLLTDDAMADSRFASSESVSNLRIHSALAVPIWTEDSLLGVLYVSHHHKVAWFDKRHLSYASSVGMQMGMAIKTDGQLRKNQALVKYMSNIRRVLEQRIQEHSAHLKKSLARQDQMVEQLLNSESTQTWGFFSRALAHQIDKPLAVLMPRLRFIAKYAETLEGICGQYGEIAASDADGDVRRVGLPDFHEPVRKIRETLLVCQAEIQEVQRAIKYLHALPRQDIAVKSSSAVGKVNVNEKIDAIIALLGPEFERHSIEVQTNLFQPPIELRCDELDLERTLFGVVLNSIESLRQKQPSRVFRRSIRIAAIKDGENAAVTVSDNGIGIPEDCKSRVFDPFYTTKDDTSGIGLGLAKARSFALRHNGHISFDNAEGFETTIRLTLPLSLSKRQFEAGEHSLSDAGP